MDQIADKTSHFTYSQDQLKAMAADVLRVARELGATDAATEISEGSGLSVTVRKGQVETIEQNRDKVRQLNDEITSRAIAPHLEKLRRKYARHEAFLKYIDAFEKDVIENVDVILNTQEAQNDVVAAPPQAYSPALPGINVSAGFIVTEKPRPKPTPA